MSEYLVKAETLTALADAARTNLGTTDSYNLSQIATMLSTANLAEPKKYHFEFYTFEEKTESYTIQHDLGFVPQYVCYFQFPYELEVGESIAISSGMKLEAGLAYNKEIYHAQVDGSSFQFVEGASICESVDATTAVIAPYGKFQAGYTYGFLFWGEESSTDA